MTKTTNQLTPYQKWFKSWKPMSAQGRAAKRNAAVFYWPPCQPPKPRDPSKLPRDMRLEI